MDIEMILQSQRARGQPLTDLETMPTTEMAQTQEVVIPERCDQLFHGSLLIGLFLALGFLQRSMLFFDTCLFFLIPQPLVVFAVRSAFELDAGRRGARAWLNYLEIRAKGRNAALHDE